jgi:ABC-2 type transport system permease protein
MGYLYDIFTLLLMYCSAIFYNVDVLPARYQGYFMLNPVYTYIKYFRMVVLQGELPSLEHHALCAFYALMALALGAWVYKKYNHEFLYYV